VEGSGCGLILRYYPRIYLEGLHKTTKNPSQDNQSPGRDLNPETPKYAAGVLITQPQHLVADK
jgi:hypothetical protein